MEFVREVVNKAWTLKGLPPLARNPERRPVENPAEVYVSFAKKIAYNLIRYASRDENLSPAAKQTVDQILAALGNPKPNEEGLFHLIQGNTAVKPLFVVKDGMFYAEQPVVFLVDQVLDHSSPETQECAAYLALLIGAVPFDPERVEKAIEIACQSSSCP
jgi:hypothetical protein